MHNVKEKTTSMNKIKCECSTEISKFNFEPSSVVWLQLFKLNKNPPVLAFYQIQKQTKSN